MLDFLSGNKCIMSLVALGRDKKLPVSVKCMSLAITLSLEILFINNLHATISEYDRNSRVPVYYMGINRKV